MINYNFLTQQMPINDVMVETNHLGAALKLRPDVLKSAIDQLFATRLYSSNTLSSTLLQNAQEETIETTMWSYQLMGGRCRPTTIFKSEYNPTTGTGNGRGKGVIILYGDNGSYLAGDIISPLNGNKEFQCRFVKDAEQIGKRFKYTLRLMTDNINASVPVRYLSPGAHWGKLFSIYEEGSDQSGSTSFNTNIGLTGSMSRFRKMYKITSDAKNTALAVRMKAQDANGNTKEADYWVKYVELMYWQQWYKELDKGYWYTRNTNTVVGSNGRPILSGAGIQQQLESGTRYFYNTLTAPLIREFILDMTFGRTAPVKDKYIYGYTGEYGLMAFSDAMSADAAKNTGFTMMTDSFVRKASSPYTSTGLSYGAQYVEWAMPNGRILKLFHDPLRDDP